MKLLQRRNNKYKWLPNGKEFGKLKGQIKVRVAGVQSMKGKGNEIVVVAKNQVV